MELENAKKEQSLRFSFLDGIFASAMIGFIQDYLTPFLLLIGATAKHVGMLNAFPNLFASLIQLKSPDLTDRLRSRRKITNIFVFLQAMMLIPMAIVAIVGRVKPILFIFFVVLFISFGAIATPGWASLMSDLVSKEKRGEYFGWRNRTLGFVMVSATFIAGFILHKMKNTNVFYGFVILFSSAAIFRMISWYFLTKMHEPRLNHAIEHRFTFLNFLKKIKESNFAKFVLFVSLMSFSVNLASPFFAVLMIRELKFNYLLYTIITVAATLSLYITIGRWGRHADRVGNLKVIKFTAPLIGTLPLLWIFSLNPIFLFIVQIFSGFIWAGFNLCASNFIYDAVTPEKRTRCIAYFNVLNGLALCAGALLGGFFISILPPLFGYKILTLFLISALLRITIGFLLPSKLKEVRPVEKVRSVNLFFSMIGIKPLLGVERKAISI